MKDLILEAIVSEFDDRFMSILDVVVSDNTDSIHSYAKQFLITSCQRYHQEKMKELVERLPEKEPDFNNPAEELDWREKHYGTDSTLYNEGFQNCLSQVTDILSKSV